jgi:hypothetical protein
MPCRILYRLWTKLLVRFQGVNLKNPKFTTEAGGSESESTMEVLDPDPEKFFRPDRIRNTACNSRNLRCCSRAIQRGS